jgi:hypothetical protein
LNHSFWKQGGLFIPNLTHKAKQGEHCIDILMRNMLVSGLFGTTSELAACQDLAMAHGLVSRLESIPKRIGRERQSQNILIKK